MPSIKSADVIILHDSGGEPYFEAIEFLLDNGDLNSLSYYETSVFFNFLKGIYKKKKVIHLFESFLKNILFRIGLPFLKNKIIILGVAPYDIRFPFYALLSINNKLIYHSSWPYWWGKSYPRKYFFLDPFIKNMFSYSLNKFSIEIVGVIPEVEETIKPNLQSNKVSVIPHCINPDVFYNNFDEKNDSRKHLLFVGRIQKEKGIYKIISIIKSANEKEFFFHIVGNGILYDYLCKELSGFTNVKIYGKVLDKVKLASIFRKCDVLLLPSEKSKKWEELFGVVIIEAMASGLVVFASDHVGPRNIIKNGVNGVIYDYSRNNEDFFVELKKYDLERVSSAAIKTSQNYSIKYISKLWMKVFE